MRKLIIGSLVAAGLASVSIPAAARSNVDVYLNFAPPQVYGEYVPAPRYGYVWVPGYWDWRYGRHHWVGGHWVRNRPGHYYQPARWARYDDRYFLHRGGWRRWDADGDGVPNRYDRAPFNPYYR